MFFVWLTLIVTVLLLAAVWLMNKLIYKHTVIIRDQGNNDLLIVDKARDYVKEGVKYWRLHKEKDKELRLMPIPDSQYIDITQKGKKVAEAVRSPEGNYEYIQIDSKDIKVKQPLTSKQRMILMNNFRKAQERKGFTWKEHIPMITSISALVIIVISLMIFWGDIAAPVLEARRLGAAEQVRELEMLNILKEIKLNQQTIGDNVEAINGGVPD